jgi:two-component system, OmpR family, response regulator
MSELKKILYAEDDTDIQEIGVLAMETLGGFTVKTCDSGDEVASAAVEFQPDLFVLDIMMPGMDGLEALRAIREIEAFKESPVIFMTAKVMKDEQAKYLALGAKDVITKPFDPTTLCDRILETWSRHGE